MSDAAVPAGATTGLPDHALPDHAPGLEKIFELEIVERHDEPLAVDGTIPDFARGVYYLAGPSGFRVGDVGYGHWLDGDGTVTRLAFTDRGPRLTHRFVETAKRRHEAEAGRALYRTFGTSFEGDRLKRGIGLESPANVSAHRFGDHLLAFGEQGLPFALDPVTLETRGEHTFGGRLNAVSPLSAHPCFTDGGDLVNFGVSFSARQPSLTLYRFSPGNGDGELVYRRRHPLPYPCSIHDFMTSERYAIFFLSPYLLDVASVMGSGKSVMEALAWRPEKGSHLLVLDLETGESVARIEAGDKYCLHLIQAYDEGSRLTVDLFELDRPVYDQYQPLPDLFVDAPAGRPRRWVVDLEAGEIADTKTLDYGLCADFPAVDPRTVRRPYEHLWMLGMSRTGERGRKFFDRLERLSWSSPSAHWQAPEGVYLGGEPVFLPDPATADGGLILCQSFDAESDRGSFLLFDALDPASGPSARVELSSAIPLGFHAVYYPD